ncbi:hypothetical protein CMI37_15310 [Candidatus Pacearchaeota archaeon]|nr:hypothetical protein [Candidatus Pacearchaeota archaeon]|tara:strand:+ start:4490 stop:5017 length:528 start_codon:yes stop_codon:yes gene_type:complete
MSDEKKINKDWENFQKKRNPEADLDAAWAGYKKKLKIISDKEALEMVKEKSRIIEEGTGERNLLELMPLCKFKGGASRGKRYMRVTIDYSIRLIQEEKTLIEKKNLTINIPSLKPGAFPRGLEIAVSEMKPDELRSVILPPELAFGAKEDIPGIPAFSTVDFEIRLVNVDCGITI